MKIHLVIDMSRILIYQEQVKRQKKILFISTERNKKKKYKVEKILNRKDVKKKPKYFIRWKEYTTEEDI